MTRPKGAWVAYRPLQAKETVFGKYISEVDKNYSLVEINGVPKKCETKAITLIYDKILLNELTR